MRHTQFLIFEANRDCNLGKVHGKCPNQHPDRCKHCDLTKLMTDEQIIDAAEAAYAQGFRGMIGFHYYNEPLVGAARMFPLIDRIKARIPAARFVLWTNGTLLPTDPKELERFRVFSRAWITKYDNGDYSRLKHYVPETAVVRWQLDNRLSTPLATPRAGGCGRAFTEMIFDYYGNVHLCCLDWRGESRIGNIHQKSFLDLLNRIKEIRQQVGPTPMLSGAPEVCTRCVGRHEHVACLLPDIARETEAFRKQEWMNSLMARADASTEQSVNYIVIIAYRIPESRVAEHFKYNGELYAKFNLIPLLVVESLYPQEIVAGARQVVYPVPLPVFSNPLCKNFGIRLAAESGARVIIAADIDVVFEPDTLLECLRVEERYAVVPVFRMIQTLENHGEEVIAKDATGVVSQLTKDWLDAHYNEQSAGYGADDTLLLRTITRMRRKVIRAKGKLWHLAHIPGTPQKEFATATPRTDHWGRAEGFHPAAFRQNISLMTRDPVDHNPRWGLPEPMADVTLVFTHYRLPEQRLQDWIGWNRDVVERMRARVIVVSDRAEYSFPIPDWMRVARFPRQLAIFNLSATSNYGIRLAGRGIIAKIDPDIFLGEKFPESVALVTERHGICPQYRMAATASADDRNRASIWEASKGAIVLHYSHWDAINGYDERMDGYGIEDGDCFHRAGHAQGFTCDRKCEPVWHIAHAAGEEFRTPERRSDYWGRATGFNPHAHKQNMSVRRAPWLFPLWGRGVLIRP